MKPTTKRALMTHITKKRDEEYHGDDKGRRYGEPEDRFRDRRGREHYDNGRYAPMDTYEDDMPNMRYNGDRRYDDGRRYDRPDRRVGMEYEPEDGYVEGRRRRDSRGRFTTRNEYDPDGNSSYPTQFRVMPPYKRESRVIRPMGKIGFSVDGEMERLDEDNYDQRRMSGMNRSTKHDRGGEPLSKQEAMEWAKGLENVDGTTGPHWTMEQVKTVMAQKGIECEPNEFFLALNMMYSDYAKVAKELGVNTIDFYTKMAQAFLDDPDAGKDKLVKYFEEVVR